MIRVALKGLAARPVRTALTTLAIVLGVAMVAARSRSPTRCAAAPTRLSDAAYDGTDAVVTAQDRVQGRRRPTGRPSSPTVAASLLDRGPRACPQVGVAVGDITDEAQDHRPRRQARRRRPVLRRRLRRPHDGRRAAHAVPPGRRPLGDRRRARSCIDAAHRRQASTTRSATRPDRRPRRGAHVHASSASPASATSSRSARRPSPSSTCATAQDAVRQATAATTRILVAGATGVPAADVRTARRRASARPPQVADRRRRTTASRSTA